MPVHFCALCRRRGQATCVARVGPRVGWFLRPEDLRQSNLSAERGSKVLLQMSMHCGADHVRGHNFAPRTTFSKILDDMER